MDTFEQRSVELLSLLGQGGFGKVYRGRVSVPGGFVRDMAIKVLHPEMATPAILARLRDEARTLLLLRDRAIVSAETPIQLGERWAVLMEYVDGMSAQEVLQELGPFPPSVAVEIVGEIARALDAAYHQEGPDGPLRLVHRDIKCANLQITRTGEVKILDFGVAVAEFDEREAKTRSMMLIGTPGYLAPERFSGIAGPESDVYALGISLFEMLAGRRPTQQEACPVSDPSPALEVACALATQMRAPDPADRPTAREVCARCREIVMSLQEISLTEWSRTIPARDSQADDQVGQMFSVSSHLALDQVGDPSGIEDPPTAAVSTIQGGRGPSPGWVGLLIGATIALLSAGIGLALVSVGGVALLMGPGLWDPEGEGLAVVADEVPGGAGPDPSGAVGASTSPLSTGGIAPGPGGDGGAAPGVAPPSPTAGADTVGVDAGTASAAEESAAGEGSAEESAAGEGSAEGGAGAGAAEGGSAGGGAAEGGAGAGAAEGSAAEGSAAEGGAAEGSAAEGGSTGGGADETVAVLAPNKAGEVASEAVAVPPSVTGRWRGSMRGLPLILELDGQGGSVRGQATIDLGAQLQTEAVSGQVEPSGRLSLQAGSFLFEGRLEGGSMSGTYRRGSARKELPWSASLEGS